MNLIKFAEDSEILNMLYGEGCVEEESYEIYRCNCGSTIDPSIINKEKEFFTCPRCQGYKKFNPNNLIRKKNYFPVPSAIKKLLKKRLLEKGFKTSERFNEIVVSFNETKIPITVLEFSNVSSLLPDNNSIILYYDLQEYEKISNVYLNKRIYKLENFLKFDNDKLKEILLNYKRRVGHSRVLKIKENISEFCNSGVSDRFEHIVFEIFDSLKQKDREIESLLNHLKKYSNTLISKKPVHIGGNHPSDIEFIDLFDYFNDFFNWNKNRGADAKMYVDSNISKKTITNKVITNHAREMVIITNQYKVEPPAWKFIWDSYKNNGFWKFFIIDLDLLSLIAYYFKLENLFYENEK